MPVTIAWDSMQVDFMPTDILMRVQWYYEPAPDAEPVDDDTALRRFIGRAVTWNIPDAVHAALPDGVEAEVTAEGTDDTLFLYVPAQVYETLAPEAFRTALETAATTAESDGLAGYEWIAALRGNASGIV